jgi:hypothetical protein
MANTRHDHSLSDRHPCPSSVGVNVYVDESGDLGFYGGSDFFVFGAVIVKTVEDELDCKTYTRRAMKKILATYKEDELKSSKLRENNRKVVIEELLGGGYDFAYLLLRKDQVSETLKNKPFGLYNWLAAKLLEDIIITYGFRADVNMIIDRAFNGVRQYEFNQTVVNRGQDRFPHLENLDVKIFPRNSKTECGIQIADVVAGCVFQHYERYRGNPTPEYNYFPRIYERSHVRMDFFENKH